MTVSGCESAREVAYGYLVRCIVEWGRRSSRTVIYVKKVLNMVPRTVRERLGTQRLALLIAHGLRKLRRAGILTVYHCRYTNRNNPSKRTYKYVLAEDIQKLLNEGKIREVEDMLRKILWSRSPEEPHCATSTS